VEENDAHSIADSQLRIKMLEKELMKEREEKARLAE